MSVSGCVSEHAHSEQTHESHVINRHLRHHSFHTDAVAYFWEEWVFWKDGHIVCVCEEAESIKLRVIHVFQFHLTFHHHLSVMFHLFCSVVFPPKQQSLGRFTA